MAGYRAGIDLALPAYDTYRCLEKFARRPNDIAVRLAYYRLRTRVQDTLLFEALAASRYVDAARTLLSLRTGISEKELASHIIPYSDDAQPDGNIVSSIDEVAAMDEAGRRRVYEELCRRHGVHIDREVSMTEDNSCSESDR